MTKPRKHQEGVHQRLARMHTELAGLHAELAEQERQRGIIAAIGHLAERPNQRETIGSRCGRPRCQDCAGGWHRAPRRNPHFRPEAPPVRRMQHPWIAKNGWPGIPISQLQGAP